MQRTFATILFLLLSIQAAQAQGCRGRDFWICLPQNSDEESNPLSLSLYITAEARATGTIENRLDSSSRPFSVESGSVVEISLDTELELTSSERTEPKSLHITSDRDIMVYVVSHRPASTDSYSAIPTNLLGMRYAVAGYFTLNHEQEPFTTQATILATEDNTLIQAKLTAATWNGLPKGRNVEFALDRGEAFQIQGAYPIVADDLTGTIFSANKPVAFFTGHRCAQVPPNAHFCDMLLEMEPPECDWGREFILTKFERKDFYVARVIAGSDSTDVSLDGRHVATLSKGAFYECDTLSSDARLGASKPVLVAQYATSSNADRVAVGDPFMLFVIPNDRFIPEVTTTSIAGGTFENYLNIVVPKSARGELRMDGLPVTAGSTAVLLASPTDRLAPGGEYEILTVELREGRHLVHCSEPIAVYSYGFGTAEHHYDSYGHACGMRLGK